MINYRCLLNSLQEVVPYLQELQQEQLFFVEVW
jgi:hypothetical protein